MIALFEDIILFKGYLRFLAVDTTREKCFFLPLLWGNLINRYNKNITDEQLIYFKTKSSQILELYNFLEEKEFIMNMNESILSNFTKKTLEYERPQAIDFISLFVSIDNLKEIETLIIKEPFGYIRSYQLIVTDDEVELKKIIDILKKMNPGRICIHIHKEKSSKLASEIANNDLIERKINIYPLDKKENSHFYNNISKKTSGATFIPTFFQIAQSSKFNSYLNKSLFIDKLGNIFSTPNFEKKPIYNLKDIFSGKFSLKDIIDDKEFTFFWDISKNEIEICKDCELRMICIDNRVPIKKGKFFRYEDFCLYNPYIGKWEEEKEFISIEQCGYYTREGSFMKNPDFIKKYNKEIWEIE